MMNRETKQAEQLTGCQMFEDAGHRNSYTTCSVSDPGQAPVCNILTSSLSVPRANSRLLWYCADERGDKWDEKRESTVMKNELLA